VDRIISEEFIIPSGELEDNCKVRWQFAEVGIANFFLVR
jgi:hypothetical protein